MDGWSASGYWLSRLVLQRGLALVYVVAFLVAALQFRPLAGERGLLPAGRFLRATPFRRAPSLFHLHYSDRLLGTVAWGGAALAAAALAGLTDRGPAWASVVAWAALWALYLSIVNVGQIWYGFGWESLLLEAGFLAVFLGPAGTAPPALVLWLFRWLAFRVEFGAGLIKLRGDRCWRDLTCLHHHHETQPMPNPLSWYFHRLPGPLHKAEVLANHFAQLVLPFLLFAPQPVAGAAAAAIAVTQGWLVLSGNFSWLNVTTIVLALSAVPDSMLGPVLPASAPADLGARPLWLDGAVVVLAALVAALSYWPVRNLLSRRQRMNLSFNSLHLVNTYGAFGTVTRVRQEVVLEGTRDPDPGPGTAWEEYGFKGKPGDARRRPPQVAPYHYRLDWLLWFVPLSPGYGAGWFEALVVRLLRNDRDTLRLLRRNPFPDAPPAFVRARIFRYRFSTRAERRQQGVWWVRTPVAELLPPVQLDGGELRRGRAAPG